MDRRVTLIVFMSFWCLSHQQGREMTLCRGNRYVLARCGAGSTPFPGQLPPGWGRMCQAGPTQCDLTGDFAVGFTQHYDQYQCDSVTWNLNYLCLPADQTVDMCQDVRLTRKGDTSLVHDQLMASRGDNVACTCVVTRSPGQVHSGVLILLYTRHLVQIPVAEAASCQGRLTLRDSVNQETGSYDIECEMSDVDATESARRTVHTNSEFEATSIDNPSSISSAAGSGDGGEGPQVNGIIIGFSVALALVVVLWLLSVGYLLRRSRLTPGKPSHGEDYQNSMNMERQTRTTVANNNLQEPSLRANNVSGVECQNDGDRRDVTMDTSGVYETVRDRDPAIQNRDVHQNEGQGRDGPNNEHIDLSSVTMNQPTRYQSSTELALQDNLLYGSPV